MRRSPDQENINAALEEFARQEQEAQEYSRTIQLEAWQNIIQTKIDSLENFEADSEEYQEINKQAEMLEQISADLERCDLIERLILKTLEKIIETELLEEAQTQNLLETIIFRNALINQMYEHSTLTAQGLQDFNENLMSICDHEIFINLLESAINILDQEADLSENEIVDLMKRNYLTQIHEDDELVWPAPSNQPEEERVNERPASIFRRIGDLFRRNRHQEAVHVDPNTYENTNQTYERLYLDARRVSDSSSQNSRE